MKEHNTVVVVFALSAKEERRHKGIPKSQALFNKLTDQTLKTVGETGLPFLHYDESNQTGDTFGCRFVNAVESAFALRYEQVIVVGNDSPLLRPKHIIEAAQRLRYRTFVLGPSTDGGFYLMGAHVSQFRSENFLGLSWQTSGLSNELRQLISAQGTEVYELSYLFDVDNMVDLENLIIVKALVPQSLFAIVVSILKDSPVDLLHLDALNTPYLPLSISHNRGSPFRP